MGNPDRKGDGPGSTRLPDGTVIHNYGIIRRLGAGLGEVYMTDDVGLEGSVVWEPLPVESIEKGEGRRGVVHEARMQLVSTHSYVATRSEPFHTPEKGN